MQRLAYQKDIAQLDNDEKSRNSLFCQRPAVRAKTRNTLVPLWALSRSGNMPVAFKYGPLCRTVITQGRAPNIRLSFIRVSVA